MILFFERFALVIVHFSCCYFVSLVLVRFSWSSLQTSTNFLKNRIHAVLLALLLDGDHDLIGLVDQVGCRSEDGSRPEKRDKC